MTSLHRVYAFYSRLGQQVNPDNAFVMTRMQFWRLLKDCQLHHQDHCLVDMDRWLGAYCAALKHVKSFKLNSCIHFSWMTALQSMHEGCMQHPFSALKS